MTTRNLEQNLPINRILSTRSAATMLRCIIWAVHASIALSLALPAVASAEEDSFGLGNGSDGAFVASALDEVINAYAPLVSDIAAGSTAIEVDDGAAFAADDLVLLWHVQGDDEIAALDDQSAVALSAAADGMGSWELVRLASVDNAVLTARSPMLHAFPANRTQVVRIPEFSSVEVPVGTSLAPMPWDGSTGGIVAFFATGDVTLEGEIQASGMGFRGGVTAGNDGGNGCSDLDQPASRGAQRGESIMAGSFDASETGRGIRINGGGGGVCHNSGGGGGAHAGAGGTGGRSWQGDGSREVGGLGGAALAYSPLSHLSLGGGGGAGHQNNNVGSDGGNGGGAIWLRGSSIIGTGALLAAGDNSPNAGNDGGGGGGAGGIVIVQSAGDVSCGLLSVSGGNGGSPSSSNHGTGGAGGGGYVLFQAATRSCTILADNGNPGTQGNVNAPGGASYGATGGIPGMNDDQTGTPFTGDQDGDGIPDIDEVVGDSDGDGVPDFRDPDDDNDGIATSEEITAALDQDPGSSTYRDSDGDGIQDYLDRDSDSDGIPDIWEAGFGAIDADRDGEADTLTDADGDGVLAFFDSNDNNVAFTTLPPALNTDGTEGIDSVDLDSDGDGIFDLVEGRADAAAISALDGNGDGVLDSFADDDNDGFADSADATNNNGSGPTGTAFPIPDTDGDGAPDFQDKDSDDDGIPDDEEGTDDDDDDGIPNFIDSNLVDTSSSDISVQGGALCSLGDSGGASAIGLWIFLFGLWLMRVHQVTQKPRKSA